MIFHQLFEPLSSTYTYLIGCEQSRQAVLVDPVYPTWERDLEIVHELGLKLTHTLETHVHADHITSALQLRETAGSRIVYPAEADCDCADLVVKDNEPFQVGTLTLVPIHTPGHTEDHYCYLLDDRVMTGDALLIDGCGRTDFQNGDAATLYRSIHHRLFRLPDDTLVFPGHDYHQRRVSSIAQEKARNPRLGNGMSETEFVAIMHSLDLAYPKFIDHAVPGNKKCGVCPSHLPEDIAVYCKEMQFTPQG